MENGWGKTMKIVVVSEEWREWGKMKKDCEEMISCLFGWLEKKLNRCLLLNTWWRWWFCMLLMRIIDVDELLHICFWVSTVRICDVPIVFVDYVMLKEWRIHLLLLFMFLKVKWMNSVLVMKMEEGDEG